MSRCLTILEVSQKQNYIFSSKKVKNNIVNSAVIAHVLGADYIAEVLAKTTYADDKNMVYSGGGHVVLEFPDENTAKEMVSKITWTIYRDFDGLVVFAKSQVFDDDTSMRDCLKKLTEALERKKSIRSAVFRQGSYGVEKMDSDTLDVIAEDSVSDAKKKIEEAEYNSTAKEFTPVGYQPVYKFEELGGSKGESNFIAVVHIDGNGMGKRVEELYDLLEKSDTRQSWNDMKHSIREFSESIDKDFKNAYKEMAKEIAQQLKEADLDKKLDLKEKKFPVRRIITAGDDICFVTEGRIGIECARIYIEKLTVAERKNSVDHKGYSACAGVAIVHQKYPFYKAYELAEMLCSNAKKYGAQISPADNGRSVSAIDWHIEFGELKDTLEEIRRSYATVDHNRLELRPYIIRASEEILNDRKFAAKKYENFKKIIKRIQKKGSTYGNGKIKGLRAALKQGEKATSNYLIFNRMEDILIENRPDADRVTDEDLLKLFTGKPVKGEAFITQMDEKKHSLLYDSIELMDSYLALEEGVARED